MKIPTSAIFAFYDKFVLVILVKHLFQNLLLHFFLLLHFLLNILGNTFLYAL